MTKKRAYEIINNKEIKDIYYEDQPVWVQELNDNSAKVGFMDSSVSKDILINDLYEKNLYNK